MKRLKYLGYAITCQEVPDEISLVLNISGCPHRCVNCHSPELWEYEGSYLANDLENIINTYGEMVSCVCFMGGDQNKEELLDLLKQVKSTRYFLKTCLYSGRDDTEFFHDIMPCLNYLKVGHYDCEKGGLNKTSTNQTFYHCENGALNNITHKFWRHK